MGRRRSHPLDKDRFVAQMDVLYRTLERLGFATTDVQDALKATMSTKLEDLLDWVGR